MNGLLKLSLAMALALYAGAAAADKPDTLTIGITGFLSGPASVFGEPAKAASEILLDDLNREGGIGGVPVTAIWVDEGAGGEHVLSELPAARAGRRGRCDVRLDLQRQLQEGGAACRGSPDPQHHVGLRHPEDLRRKLVPVCLSTQANATPEMLSTLLYLLKTKPEFESIAVVNQDYAWGRDSWHIFSTALKQLKPGVRVVAELFPKFGAPDFSTEISRLLALRPDVILSTAWGGDLDNFVRQSVQRGLTERSTFVLPLMESSLQRIGPDMPEGVIVGGRGDHYFLHPEFRHEPDFQAFIERYKAETGEYPIYPVFHIAQALSALKGAYEKAIAANDGAWPGKEQVVDAMEGLEFRGLGRTVHIREDHQGVEDQMIGMTRHDPAYDFAVMDHMMIFPGSAITTPAGMESTAWLETLSDSILDLPVQTYRHAE